MKNKNNDSNEENSNSGKPHKNSILEMGAFQLKTKKAKPAPYNAKEAFIAKLKKRGWIFVFCFFIAETGVSARQVWNAGIQVWNAGIQTWSAERQTWNAEMQTWSAERQTWNAGIQTWNAGIQTWNAERQTWNAGMQTWRAGIQTWKSRIAQFIPIYYINELFSKTENMEYKLPKPQT